MADADDVRRLALALPHVEEIDSDGFDFRVGGRGFVWSYPERIPGEPRVIRTDIAVLYVGDEAEKQALLLGEPRLFFTAPGYEGWPLVMLRLAEVDAERLAELVTDAWRMRAPREIEAELEALRPFVKECRNFREVATRRPGPLTDRHLRAGTPSSYQPQPHWPVTLPSMTTDAVATHYSAPEYKRLLDAARRSLERTGGDLTRTVTVKTPDDKERRAIIGITGQYRPEGAGVLAVRLTDLDNAVRETAGDGLIQLLERLGPPLKDRPAERLKLIAGRDTALRSVQTSVLKDLDWFQRWLAEIAADGTITKLINAGDKDPLRQPVRILEWIEQRIELNAAPMQLPELAATITGDTKALTPGTTLATLVLRALAVRQGVARPKTTEERRELWDQCGIVVDDLASRVLVLNLPAQGAGLGEWLTGAASHGTPFYVTLHQLVTFGLTIRVDVVHACENPAILRRAAAELGARARPLICTEGQPSTAFHRLAAAVTDGGGTLTYHGDFDWPGITIAANIITRHNAAPWRMSAADYEQALRGDADLMPLTGEPRPTPWDPSLAEAMTVAAFAVYEESVATALIADLAKDQGQGPQGASVNADLTQQRNHQEQKVKERVRLILPRRRFPR